MSRTSWRCVAGGLAWLCSWAGLAGGAAGAADFQVSPPKVELRKNFAQAQLLVTEQPAQDSNLPPEKRADLTTRAQYVSSHPQVVTVSATGRLLAVGNGSATITITAEGVTKSIPVSVSDVESQPAMDFHSYVAPILSKAGCNGGSCHASQHGKGGFTLSVFGFEPDADHRAIVRDRIQRRINLNNPTESLLLQKPTMTVPHGGGQRLDKKSVDYQILAAWIGAGAPAPIANPPKVVKISVQPTHRLGELNFTQQLAVQATYSDGTTRDVTAWAKYDTMDDAVAIPSATGLVTAVGRGQVPVMVRFDDQAVISMFTVPYSPVVNLADWKNHNIIDEMASAKFRELGITPSGLCDDATFVRRAFLDAIGTLPSVAETREFLQSTDPRKREKLVDRLLGLTGDPKLDIYNDQYAAYWTLKWADLIRNSSATLGEQGMWAFHNWLLESFRTNKPFDQFVRELVTAQGSIYSNGPANYFRIANNPADLAEATAQLFLGVRLQCAKCHHHPFEKYSQADYYGFASFFSRVSTKNSHEFGIFGRETVVVVKSTGDVRHPKTNALMKPTPLDGEPVDDPLDRRLPLAKWLTAKENEFFSRNVVNRYMAYCFGRGLVDPIDDMRATNPPSNPALMDALAKEFRDSNYNLKQLLRLMLNSRLYQLDSQPTPQNASDSRFYSSFKVKRLPAEVLLDSIDIATGASTKYPNLPTGTRAIELPDGNYPLYFLTTFGKPKRVSVCECERVPEENLSQALHTLNGDTLANKVSFESGRIARLVSGKKSHEDIVTELYLATLCRLPTAPELEASHRFLAESPSPTEYYQDLLWALINSKQFLFVR